MNVNDARKEMKYKMKEMGFNDPTISCRRTGRSTALALIAIGEAIKNPNTEIILCNHWVPGVHANSGTFRRMNEDLMSIAQKIAHDLGLTCLEFKSNKHCIVKFNLTPWHKL